MEEHIKNQQSSSLPSVKTKLQYPLRSAPKKSPQMSSTSSLSTLIRGRTSNMSKSVSILELSGNNKEKSAKPERRLSIPPSSRQKSTPISETRSKKLINGQEKSGTPLSEVSRSSILRKFNLLSSASYWLSQVKVSESLAKHSISLGFFKLALEAGCEPKQRLREELKSYVQRHNLAEYKDTLKALLESYEISETLEQLQESSVLCYNAPENENTLSSNNIQSTSSIAATKKLKPKSPNTDMRASLAKASSKKTNVKKITPVSKIRATGGYNIKEKVDNLGKQELKKIEKSKNKYEKICTEEVMVKSLDMEETLEGNKENMIKEVSIAEEN